MHRFLDSNPGLRSRFAREITFPDYTTDELLAITRDIAGRNEYAIAADADVELRRIFDNVKRGEGFGNARFARTLFEQALNSQAVRLSGELDTAGATELMELHAPDIASAARALGEQPDIAPRRRWGRQRG
jgi:stage V sporulation protein K